MKSEKLTQSELGKEPNMSQYGISEWLLLGEKSRPLKAKG